MVEFLLFLLAAILIIAGVVRLVQRDWIFGAILIVLGLLVGPSGVSLFG